MDPIKAIENDILQPLDILGFEGNKTPRKHFLHVLYEKYFKYLSSKITNDAGCTLEIKSRITIAKSIQNGEESFHQKTGLKYKRKLVKF